MTTPPAAKIALRVVGGATTAALVLAGGWAVVTELASTTTTETIDLPASGVRGVSAQVEVGDVRLVESRGVDGIQVELRRHGAWRTPDASAERVGDQVQVSGTCVDGPWGNCSVDVIVRVPAGSDLTARGATSVGDVTVSGAWSQLDLETATGEVTGSDLKASGVRARSSVGDVRLVLTQAPDLVEVRSDVGEVLTVVPADGTAYDVQVRTEVGTRLTTVPVDPASPHRIEVTSSVGDVTVVDSSAPEARDS